jgi:hypothetical protein
MPRSIQDIIDHADELAHQFEQLNDEEAVEVPVEEYLLHRAVIARARSEQALLKAVAGARASGMSWQRIGAVLGTSTQAAQQKYSPFLETA